MADLIFSHCQACAENDEGENGCDPGVGCPAYGPSDDCEAVWIEASAGRAALDAGRETQSPKEGL